MLPTSIRIRIFRKRRKDGCCHADVAGRQPLPNHMSRPVRSGLVCIDTDEDLKALDRPNRLAAAPAGYHGGIELGVFSRPRGRRADRTRPETDDEES